MPPKSKPDPRLQNQQGKGPKEKRIEIADAKSDQSVFQVAASQATSQQNPSDGLAIPAVSASQAMSAPQAELSPIIASSPLVPINGSPAALVRVASRTSEVSIVTAPAKEPRVESIERAYNEYDKALQFEKEGRLAEAADLFIEAAKLGNSLALRKLAFLEKSGEEKEKEKSGADDKAIAALKVDAKAQFELALSFANTVKENEVIKKFALVFWYEMAAGRGNLNALFNLGMLSEFGGNGIVKINPEDAFLYYKRAAERGHMHAKYRLGLCFKSGTGIEKNEINAEVWLQDAACDLKDAADKDPEAKGDYGRCLLNGDGVKKNVKEGMKWLMQAAAENVQSAQYELGEYLRDGVDGVVIQDQLKAAHYFQAAAASGHVDAMVFYGQYLENGDHIAKDQKAAVEYYRRAAERGHARAQFLFADCLNKGIGVEKDQNAALQWFKKAIQQGSEVALEEALTIEVDKIMDKGLDKKAIDDSLNYISSKYRALVGEDRVTELESVLQDQKNRIFNVAPLEQSPSLMLA